VVRDGLEGLVRDWESLAGIISTQYEGTWEEWLNDVDGREIIHRITPLIAGSDFTGVRERIARADSFFKAATKPSECQWGPRNEKDNRWTSERNWWYYREPFHPGPNWLT
jgi:hypothetical protein